MTVASLCHFDGSNGSTVITDETGKIWTAGGNAQISTAQSKFGGSSLFVDGTGDFASTPAHADFSMAGKNYYTFDKWIRPTALPGGVYCTIFSQEMADFYPANFADVEGVARNIRWIIRKESGGDGDVINITTSGVTITVDNWYHLRFVKSLTNFYVFINGVLRGSATSSTTIETINASFFLGYRENATTSAFTGYIEEFYAIDEALATSDFTPPSSPYAYSPTTNLGAFFPLLS